jgi:hypothetical protein
MDITGISSIPNITNQITTGAPQAGFCCDSSATTTSGNGMPKSSTPLRHLDVSGRQGYREDYSIRDAAESLWKQENVNFNIFDPASISRMQERVRSGLYKMTPTEDELNTYIDKLRQTGLDGTVDWSGLSRELDAFKSTTPEELEDGLDYLASRYVAVLDKLERNFQGDELAAQKSKLEEVYQAGKSGMIDNYTKLLQDNLGISSSNAQAVKDSFSAILTEKVDAYHNALEKVNEGVDKTGADSVWLKNHDAYMASQLRAAGTTGQSSARYSVQDLAAAGQIAQSYQTEMFNAASCGRNEATLGLNLSMADMKAETLISKGLVSESMAALLRGSRAQGHENVLNALNQALAARESNRASGEPKGTYAPVDRAVFEGIYQTVMNAYRQNGGNGAEAIRAGAAYGQKLTTQATAKNPNALRWGVVIDDYWKNFYKAPDFGETTPLDRQVEKLMAQIGKTSSRNSSTYQKYVDSWQSFLTALGEGNALNVRA